MDGWMDGWMDEWIDGWMDGWMDGWTNAACLWLPVRRCFVCSIPYRYSV